MKQETLEKLNKFDWNAPADGKHKKSYFTATVSERLAPEYGIEISEQVEENFKSDSVKDNVDALYDVHKVVGQCTGVEYQPTRKEALIAFVAYKHGFHYGRLNAAARQAAGAMEGLALMASLLGVRKENNETNATPEAS